MTDTLENAHALFCGGKYTESLAMYNRIRKSSAEGREKGIAASMAMTIYKEGLTGPGMKKAMEEAGMEGMKYSCPLARFYFYTSDQEVSDEEFTLLLTDLRSLAKEGNSQAMVQMGLIYAYGIHLREDLEKAGNWLEKAAKLGNPIAMLQLAFLYLEPDFSKADDHEAYVWTLKSAASGYREAEFQLAYFFWRGIGIEEDQAKAVFLFRKAADAGQTEACGALFHIYTELGFEDENGKEVLDPEKGFLYAKKGASLDDHDCTMDLAFCYYRGLGTEKDFEKAREWYEKAWNCADPAAGCALGTMYAEGCFGDDRKKEGISYLNQAIREGSVDAIRELGLCYAYGMGVEIDQDRAISLLQEGVSEKDGPSARELGKMYLKDRKFQESFDAFRKADEYNDGEGSFYLALFYIKGVMVPKNFKKAQEILYRSAGNGYKWAKDLLDKGFSHIEGIM